MAITSFYGVITESDIDNEENTSLVTVRLYASWNFGSYAADNPPYSITIDGTAYTGTANFNTERAACGNDVFVVAVTKSVTHDSDGSKTVGVSAWWYGQNYPSGPDYTYSGSKVLTKIPRGLLRVKAVQAWKTAEPYIKVGGVWKRCSAYVKTNGNWEQGV